MHRTIQSLIDRASVPAMTVFAIAILAAVAGFDPANESVKAGGAADNSAKRMVAGLSTEVLKAMARGLDATIATEPRWSARWPEIHRRRQQVRAELERRRPERMMGDERAGEGH
jgi:hypothetical protein